MLSDKAPSRPDIAPPDAASLYEAALSYLARYAATETGLRQILLRAVDRWARAQPDRQAASDAFPAARQAIDEIVARLVQAGAVSDVAFAASRAKTLVRAGQSNRSVQARLIAKGVQPELARAAAVTDAATQLAAALVLLRKRRLGPYRVAAAADATVRNKEMGVLARAGFSREIAQQALDVSREEAESRIHDLRQ